MTQNKPDSGLTPAQVVAVFVLMFIVLCGVMVFFEDLVNLMDTFF